MPIACKLSQRFLLKVQQNVRLIDGGIRSFRAKAILLAVCMAAYLLSVNLFSFNADTLNDVWVVISFPYSIPSL
jgi:hypothetical protein